jgi:molybdate transport system ATP-binding protein
MPRKEPRAPTPFVSLRGATFRLGDRLIFENTNWSLGRHEQWAIVGPNGSGKSVLADGLRGRLPLVGGELRYFFRPPPGVSPEEAIGHVAFEDRKAEVHGTVVQSRWTSFEEEGSVSVSDFLSYERVMEINPFEVSARHGKAKTEFYARLARVARLVQIEPLLARRLLALSNGERQRIELARAMARPLRLLILDEPYAGLDASGRQRFHVILEQLLKTGLRVLMVTALTEDLPRQITHLLWVNECQVSAAGPRHAVLAALRGRPHRRAIRARIPSSPRRKTPASAGAAAVNLIELRNVTVRYGTSIILKNLSWTVRAGESWALLGPNGSGKTTLLSLIQGDNPQAYLNEVMVFGRRRGSGQSIWHLKKQIGWVSPELHLHFDDAVSVLNVILSGFHDTIGMFERATPRQMAAARHWLKRFELNEAAELPLFSLSAGLQRMALFARAVVKRPRLLILDEPCQGLDRAHRELVVRHVDALVRSKEITAIFVTHRPEEIPPSIKNVLRLPNRPVGNF